ncbi:MAG: maleylpyruvate isomerase family mycothiol-dependent enzyme [Jatrophihabitans sp.]
MALDFLAYVRSESQRFAAALRHVDPAAAVPSCPDWTAADLLWHLAGVHSMWAMIVRDRVRELDPEAAPPPRPDAYDALFDFYERSTAELVDALASTPDDTPVWTWAPDQHVGFVRRFQAHEALIHRIDAELTAGTLPTPLPPDLAADGIDVVLRYSMSWRPGWATWTPTGGVGLIQASDTGDRHTVRLGGWGGTSPDTGKTFDDEAAIELADDAAPTFSVTAPAANLDAWLWNRPGFAEVSVDGSADDAERFRTQVVAGVQ